MPVLPAGRRWLTGLGGLVLLAAPLAAQIPSSSAAAERGVALLGRVERPVTCDLTALEALPPITLQVTRTTSQGVQTTSYTGALLWTLVSQDFEGKQVLIAYAQDGKPLPDLRLVVPADAKPGRSVRDIVAVEVR